MSPVRLVPRLLAFLVDWLVIAAWGGLLFGTVMFSTGGTPPRPSDPWSAQAIGLLTMTLPVVLYFAFTESSRARASLGKSVLGLAVVGDVGGRLPFRLALLRTVAKLAPWELGHTVAQQAVASRDAGAPLWVWIPMAASLLGPAWWAVSIATTGRAPYDRWAGAWVVRRTPEGR